MAPKEFKYETYRKSTDLIKARLEKLDQSVDNIVSSGDVLTPVQIRQLNTILSELKKKRADFETNLLRIVENESEEVKSDILSADQDTINDLYVKVSSYAEAALTPDPTTPSASDREGSETHTFPPVIASVKLPKLNLPTFDGTPLKWISFINLFDTTVHKNSALSNVAKFQYLLSILIGEPLTLVKTLNLTAPNYLIAYNLLRDRYHNTRRLTTLHLHALMDLPSLSHGNPGLMRSFITTFYEHTEALKALNCDVSQNNPFFAAHLLRKIDNNIIQKLEQYRYTQDDKPEAHSLPQITEIIAFLNLECSQIEDASLHSSASEHKGKSSYHSTSYKSKGDTHKRTYSTHKEVMMSVAAHVPPSKDVCFCCHSTGHKIYACPEFKNKSPNERFQNVKYNKRCISCLGNHQLSECRSKATCMTCHKRHHTLLHFNASQASSHPTKETSANVKSSTSVTSTEAALTCATQTNQSTTVLLGTALVKLTAANGRTHVFRALLDCGSTSDFLTEHAAQLLGSRRYHSNTIVTGLSQASTYTKGLMPVDVESLSGHSIATQHPFHILEKISIDLPRVDLAPEIFAKVKPFVLADPTFHVPGPIDVLLGCSLFPQVLTNDRHSLGKNMPYALGTLFGYIIVGNAQCATPLSPRISNLAISLLATADIDLHSSLQRFWTQEEVPQFTKKDSEEILCDEHFSKTHSRDPDGRYIVRLPFKTDKPALGSSYLPAERRLHSLERKFATQPSFHEQYVSFMDEYNSLGHMKKVEPIDITSPHYYLPHHGVLKENSSSTKLRTVFDASSKTSTGHSLNDVLLTGRKLQIDICDIIVHFRSHNIVLSCDIRQMYRQILVHPDDQKYQLILWRDNPSKDLDTYQLTTVTYGVNSSPYLAIKTLHQLAADEGARFPDAAKVLTTQTYVDDIISGADTVDEALKLQKQLIGLLSCGGFELRKWVSNSPELTQNLPLTHQESPVFLQASSEPHFSILGMFWSPVSDSFKYSFNFSCATPTKRKVLSIIAQIYDPCGFLSPCIMIAKCFMQVLWASGTSWDEPLSSELTLKWHSFVTDLNNLDEITIPRALKLSSTKNFELHGFSDASESGYAAVVYVRCVIEDEVRVTQVMAKTRVAPLKRVTLPRLELCAAHLLARLAKYCLSKLEHTLTMDSIHLWCDSTVTLSWLQTTPYRLKTYVANRVAQTQELFSTQCWRHVSSVNNPADCASRGILPSELVNHPLWWHGPAWLQLPPSHWPKSDFTPCDPTKLEELKPIPLTVLHANTSPPWDVLLRFSSWTKLLNVVAYVLRFIHHSRRKKQFVGPLSASELQAAQQRIFLLVQKEAFLDEFNALRDNKRCSSRLQRLAPFLDEDGLIRVGGRLRHADLPHSLRHPCVLPKKHHVVNILIDFLHVQHLHAGAQLTMSLLIQHAWVFSARSVVRSRIFRCLVCFKHKPRNDAPLMGDLPRPRVTPARPFASSGVDYGGPFFIKVHNLRSTRQVKAYICVFVCLVTKAVHIEVATDLSTDSFIAALTRFVSRRGLCHDIYSDCATNFVGARNALQDLVITNARPEIERFALQRRINFHFNPPAAPHQGGLWESAIKSVKFHLKRTLGTYVPTLSQFMTLTCKAEAMLNSRPLTALSSDPNDLQALTPGHFLIGAPLAAVPEPALCDLPDNRLSQWQLCQAFSQRIWNRWSKEYLHTLQQRLKWNYPTRNLEVGDLVLVHQDTPSLNWPLGRVTKVTPGPDNTVRVVQIKTQQGTYTRPAIKVFLLPYLTDTKY